MVLPLLTLSLYLPTSLFLSPSLIWILKRMLQLFLQGFLNLVLAICDVTDSVVLFAPYFFNAYMSFRMTGITNILVGPSDPNTLLPDPGSNQLQYFSAEC